MAQIYQAPKVDLVLTFVVNEAEARALDALAGYGDDAFIKAFYEKLGTHYMVPHEHGLRSFLKSIRDFVPNALSRLDHARKAFDPAPTPKIVESPKKFASHDIGDRVEFDASFGRKMKMKTGTILDIDSSGIAEIKCDDGAISNRDLCALRKLSKTPDK